jgi:protease-4
VFGSLAASGGYYVAAASDYIVAEPTTITGSIGVIVSTWKYHEAADKLGLKPETFISGDTPYKDILSGARPTREEEREIVLGIVQEMYERFVQVVDDGRDGLKRDEVKRLADGRIYTAAQALQNKLVDQVGYGDAAIGWIKKQAGIDRARLVKFQPAPTLLDVLTGRPVASSAALAELLGTLPLHVRGRFLYLWSGF